MYCTVPVRQTWRKIYDKKMKITHSQLTVRHEFLIPQTPVVHVYTQLYFEWNICQLSSYYDENSTKVVLSCKNTTSPTEGIVTPQKVLIIISHTIGTGQFNTPLFENTTQSSILRGIFSTENTTDHSTTTKNSTRVYIETKQILQSVPLTAVLILAFFRRQ